MTFGQFMLIAALLCFAPVWVPPVLGSVWRSRTVRAIRAACHRAATLADEAGEYLVNKATNAGDNDPR